MRIEGSVALVTGANRGLGQVYGAARDAARVIEPGVTPIALDITDAGRVAQVAGECGDVSLLVNNAGVMRASTFSEAPNLDAARQEMETNYFGTLGMCRAFAPVLADERTRFVKASLARDHELIYPPVQKFWDDAIAARP